MDVPYTFLFVPWSFPEDIIDWFNFFYRNEPFTRSNLYAITSKFNSFFDKECWGQITTYSYGYAHSKYYKRKFIIKYRDKLDWDNLSENVDFELEFISKMKDYINFDKYFSKLHQNERLRKQMELYTREHLEEVLAYKKDDVDEKNSN